MPACRVTDDNASADRSRAGIAGTLLAIDQRGLLITGESGCGKSLLALGLLDRGHALISDDLVELEADTPALIGHCPTQLRGRLEVRGIGLVDVCQLFGPMAWRDSVRIERILHLQRTETAEVWHGWPRPDGQRDYRTLLGVRVPRLTLPIGGDGISPLLAETSLRHGTPVPAGGVDDG